jgi:hypothetical protein
MTQFSFRPASVAAIAGASLLIGVALGAYSRGGHQKPDRSPTAMASAGASSGPQRAIPDLAEVLVRETRGKGEQPALTQEVEPTSHEPVDSSRVARVSHLASLFPDIIARLDVDGRPLQDLDMASLSFAEVQVLSSNVSKLARELESKLLQQIPAVVRERLDAGQAKGRFERSPESYFVQDPDVPSERFEDIRYVELTGHLTPELRQLRELSVVLGAQPVFQAGAEELVVHSMKKAGVHAPVSWKWILHGSAYVGLDATGAEVARVSMPWTGLPF